jgi:23S rRNA (guanosine2251-2'-O)-methyltransferase
MILALNNIRSAWNVGAIMRTCDALGASIILIGYTPKPVGSTLKMLGKTAIGAEATVSWEHFDSYQECLDKYQNYIHLGVEIDKTSQDVASYLSKNQLNDNTILWLGNEISGLENHLMKKLDAIMHLPMNGIKESLNVASTACTVGYLCYYNIQNKK